MKTKIIIENIIADYQKLKSNKASFTDEEYKKELIKLCNAVKDFLEENFELTEERIEELKNIIFSL